MTGRPPARTPQGGESRPGAASDVAVRLDAAAGHRDAETLAQLTEVCELAADLVSRGRDAYDQDPLLRLASEAMITRLGEGVGRLADETLALADKGVPSAMMRGMRNRVVHEYHRIDYDVVWTTLERDLPRMKVVLGDISTRLQHR